MSVGQLVRVFRFVVKFCTFEAVFHTFADVYRTSTLSDVGLWVADAVGTGEAV